MRTYAVFQHSFDVLLLHFLHYRERSSCITTVLLYKFHILTDIIVSGLLPRTAH